MVKTNWRGWFNLSTEKFSEILFTVPKFSGFIGVSLKFSEGLLRDYEQRPMNYAPFLLCSYYHDIEVVDRMFPLSLTGFLVNLSLFMFGEEVSIKYG